jgi:hypothetical protein
LPSWTLVRRASERARTLVCLPNALILPEWRTETILHDRLPDLGGSIERGRELMMQ